MTHSSAQTLRLQVQGMSCSGCEQRIGAALRRLDGVVEATADHVTGEVRLRFDPASTDRGAVFDRIGLAGYIVEADTDTNNDIEPVEGGDR